MNGINFNAWSEKQQVAAVILIAALLIVLPCYFLLLPQMRQSRALEHDLDAMKARLAASNLLMGEDALVERLRHEQMAGSKLRDEWQATVAHLTASAGETNGAAVVGSIDFKMALFEVEQRLLKKGRESGILLPPRLGVRETVESDQDARMLMHQLRAVEKLVTLALELEIKSVRTVQPLPVRQHAITAGGAGCVEEYPVHVQFYGTLRDLYDLLHGSLQRGTALVLRNLMVETASPETQDSLQVDAVLSTLVFVQDPSAAALRPKRMVLVKARGY